MDLTTRRSRSKSGFHTQIREILRDVGPGERRILTLPPVENATLRRRVYSDAASVANMLWGVGGYRLDARPDRLVVTRSDGSPKLARWTLEEVDRLLDQGSTIKDIAERLGYTVGGFRSMISQRRKKAAKT